MATLTLRGVKGSPLTNQEVDDNFSALNTDKYESGDSPTFADVTADSVQITGGTGTQGTLSWNTDDETLDLIVSDNVTYQLGQETGLTVRNLSGGTLVNGSVVRVSGASGSKLTVALADASTEIGSAPTVGIVTETIHNNSTGRVTTAGFVRGLNTSAFTEGAPIYLGSAGTFTSTKPASPNHLVHIGWVVRSHATEGFILVHVNNGWEIDELHDVLITNIQDGQILQWDTTNGYWKNIDIPVSLPDQTGASGKFLTTNGTAASWEGITESDITDLQNYAVVDANVSFNNVVVDGNLTVNGTTTTINATNLAVTDNMIYLGEGNTTENIDLGLAGNYNDGVYAHAGFFRDASDGRWKAYHGYTPEPDAAPEINTGHASFTLSDVQFAVVHATGGNSSNWNTAYGWGNHASAGYLTSFTETDPVFVASEAYNITSTDTSNWDTAYLWGNHALAGYQPAASAITTSNIAAQSVSHASTADNATTVNDISDHDMSELGNDMWEVTSTTPTSGVGKPAGYVWYIV